MPNNNYTIKDIDTSSAGLHELSMFLIHVFKNNKLTPQYLEWIYKQNPNGEVIGFNAYNENRLAAHYALIPISANYKNQRIKALLSINTATMPKHQGQGLFTNLANKTYMKCMNLGFEIVFAVANASSIDGFINKLDFKHIGQLDTFISFTYPRKIVVKNLEKCLTFPLPKKVFKWRLSNPNYKYCEYNIGGISVISKNFNIFSRFILKISDSDSYGKQFTKPKINFWIGISNSYSWSERPLMGIKIPNFLKPSPLHLIYKNLSSDIKLNKASIHFEAINFDAF
jgi:hypothetical protein